MRYLVLFIILALQPSSIPSFAQLDSVSGTVSDEFGPLPGAKVKIEGTEVGMYIIKKLVDTNNEEIELSSEIGKGLTYYISLPTKSN